MQSFFFSWCLTCFVLWVRVLSWRHSCRPPNPLKLEIPPMEYTIKLSAPSWPELADAILEMARQIEGGASSPVEAQRMAAAVTAASNATEASSPPPAAYPQADEEKPAEAEPVPAAAPEVSLEDVRAMMIRVGREVGREKAKELIEAQGATKLTDVPAERLGELLEAARAALGVSE